MSSTSTQLVHSNGPNKETLLWSSGWTVSTSPPSPKIATAVAAVAAFGRSVELQELQKPLPRTAGAAQKNLSPIDDLATQVERLIQKTNLQGGSIEGYVEALHMVNWHKIGDTPENTRLKELAAQALIGLNYLREYRGDGRYFNEALRLLVNGNCSKLESQAYLGLGRISKGDEIIINYRIALVFSSKISDQCGQALAHEGLANIYHGKGDLEKAFEHLQQAAELMNDSRKKTEALIKLGNWFWHAERRLNSLVAHWKGWQLASFEKKVEFEKLWRGEKITFTPNTTEEQKAVKWYQELQAPFTQTKHLQCSDPHPTRY